MLRCRIRYIENPALLVTARVWIPTCKEVSIVRRFRQEDHPSLFDGKVCPCCGLWLRNDRYSRTHPETVICKQCVTKGAWPGWVYLASSWRGYKIGFSYYPTERLKKLTFEYGPCTLVHKIHYHRPYDAEKQWHERFAAQRICGENMGRRNGRYFKTEWFNLSKADVAEFKGTPGDPVQHHSVTG